LEFCYRKTFLWKVSRLAMQSEKMRSIFMVKYITSKKTFSLGGCLAQLDLRMRSTIIRLY